MIVVRGVFQAKYGKSDELVRVLKESYELWPVERGGRILTDLSGLFFTVVSEGAFESFSAYEIYGQKVFGDSRFAAWFERMVPLVESGRREFYNLAE